MSNILIKNMSWSNNNNNKQKELLDLNKELRNTGIVLIILGILQILSFGIFEPFWGFILIPLGILSLFYRSRKMLLILGILLILVGLWNITLSIAYTSGWTILGFFQIYWGIQEINRFRSIKTKKYYTWECVKCGREFRTEREAVEHEKTCNKKRIS